MGWVLRGGYGKSCSPVDPSDTSRMPRMTAWPGNNEDTDVQTRDCARFKSTGVSEVPSRVNGGAYRFLGPDLSCLLEWQGRGRRYCRHRRDGGGSEPVRR